MPVRGYQYERYLRLLPLLCPLPFNLCPLTFALLLLWTICPFAVVDYLSFCPFAVVEYLSLCSWEAITCIMIHSVY